MVLIPVGLLLTDGSLKLKSPISFQIINKFELENMLMLRSANFIVSAINCKTD